MEKKFGDRLLEIRTAKGMTQAEFAELLGMPFRTYQQLEYNKNKPMLDTFMLVCKGLELTPNQVLEVDPLPQDEKQSLTVMIEFLQAFIKASKYRRKQALEILEGGADTLQKPKVKA